MADPAVSIERRRRDPAFLAALAALALSVLALVTASHDLFPRVGAGGWGVAAALLAAVGALAVAGLVVRSRLAANRRAHEREAFFAQCVARLQGPVGFARTLGTVLQDGRAFFRARGVAVPLRNTATGQAFLWSVPAGAAPGTPAEAVELRAEAAEDWLFEVRVEAWEAARVGGHWRALSLDEAGRAQADSRAVPSRAVDKLARRLGAQRLAAVGFRRGRDWEGRLVLADAGPEGPGEEACVSSSAWCPSSGASPSRASCWVASARASGRWSGRGSRASCTTAPSNPSWRWRWRWMSCAGAPSRRSCRWPPTSPASRASCEAKSWSCATRCSGSRPSTSSPSSSPASSTRRWPASGGTPASGTSSTARSRTWTFPPACVGRSDASSRRLSRTSASTAGRRTSWSASEILVPREAR